MKNTKKRGFTIVELVIVIAVIAILASVLIPTFTKVVEAAKASKNLQEARNAYTEALAEHLVEGDTCAKSLKHTVNDWEVTFEKANSAVATSITKSGVATIYAVDANGKFDVKPAAPTQGGTGNQDNG